MCHRCRSGAAVSKAAIAASIKVIAKAAGRCNRFGA